jgi:exosome complex component RRP42
MSVTSQIESIAKIRSKQMLDLLSSGKRVDGRDLHSYRDIKVEIGVIDKAEGSASVSLGNTKVLVGIKVETGEPFPDTPDEGVLTVNSEFVPLAYELFEPGPPDENSIELARVVDRGIRESKAIDLKKIAIVPGRKVFVIFIDIYILNHDGNLIDAAAFAALAALQNTKIPNYELTDMGDIKIKPGYTPLPMKEYPVSISMVKISDKLIVDPNMEEENIADSRITITTMSNERICAIQKSFGTFTYKEILEAEKIAYEKSKEIRKKLVKLV